MEEVNLLYRAINSDYIERGEGERDISLDIGDVCSFEECVFDDLCQE